jgi:hypothetical protein
MKIGTQILKRDRGSPFFSASLCIWYLSASALWAGNDAMSPEDLMVNTEIERSPEKFARFQGVTTYKI